MLPVISFGSLAIQTPGLVFLAGLWLGLALAEKKYSRFAVNPTVVNNLVFVGLVSMLLGGRIVYVAENLSAFIKSPASLISLSPSLWDLQSGVAIGLGVSAWYGMRHQVSFWSLLDALTPGFAVMMVAAGLANLASGNAYGEPAHLPWSIFQWGEWRHPAQVYQTLAATLILFLKVLMPVSGKREQDDQRSPAGIFFLEFAAWSAAAQLLLGAFRVDGSLVGGLVRTLQVEAWLFLAACLILLGRRKRQMYFISQPMTPGENDTGDDQHH